MNQENVVHLHNGVLRSYKKKPNNLMKFAGKLMEVEKNYPE